jgi:hypothetical protein
MLAAFDVAPDTNSTLKAARECVGATFVRSHFEWRRKLCRIVAYMAAAERGNLSNRELNFGLIVCEGNFPMARLFDAKYLYTFKHRNEPGRWAACPLKLVGLHYRSMNSINAPVEALSWNVDLSAEYFDANQIMDAISNVEGA